MLKRNELTTWIRDFQRVEHDQKKGKEDIQWIDCNLEILLTYIYNTKKCTFSYWSYSSRGKET